MSTKSLEQSARLATIGQTCAGLTRDMATPLNVISMLAEGTLLQLQLPDDQTVDMEEVEQVLNQIVAQTRRLTNMVVHLTQLARQRSPNERKNTDINTIVKSTIQLKKNRISLAGVSLKLNLGKGLPPVLVDPFRIEQILLNLVNNALDALDEYQRNNADLEWKKKLHISSKVENRQIIVDIVDNGSGINKKDRGRVFNAFFTTKGEKGAGLGLYTSRDIAKQYGGDLEFVTIDGRGTTFRLRLPIAEG